MEKITLDKMLELKEQMLLLNKKAWPEFMLHWDCPVWSQLFSTFANYQIVFIENGKVIAFGHTIPLYWDSALEKIPDNIKILIEKAVEDNRDPWLRVHARLGGTILKTAETSMTIIGNVNEWQEWTKMKVFESGKYILEGALAPVKINTERNIGIYNDPCIWIKYKLIS